MKDLVESLRRLSDIRVPDSLYSVAADEIERLNSVIRGQEIKFGFESSEYKKRIQTLEEELVDERMIHAACGVIALSDREMELRNELSESQAREALKMPYDDTALLEYRKHVLCEVADDWRMESVRDELRKMAEE